jgi:PAS domain S-box-containing protein
MTVLRFLLLEENLLDAERIEVTLRGGGIDCELLRVENRASFVAALAANRVDLILADYILPEFDGMSALAISRDACPAVPFIFVADRLGEEVAIDALKNGATDYVLKQRLERLVPSIQRALREAQTRQEYQGTDKSLCESERLATEAKYRSLFESIDEGFCICQMLFDQNDHPQDYRFLEVNPAFGRLTGLEQAIGKTVRELVPDLEAFWIETYGKVVRTGEAVRFEQQSIALNRWFDVNAFRIGEPQHNQFGILFTNISDRKRMEQERERFLAVSSDLQVITNKNGYFQWVSPSVERLLGWTHDEMTSRPWTEFVHPDDIGASVSEANNLFLGNETFAFKDRYRHKDGSYRWLLWKAQPYLEEQVLYGAAVDITDLQQTEEQLRKSRAFLTHITDVAPIILYVYDLRETRNIWSNNNLSLVLGYTPDEVQAMGADVLPLLLHPEDAERYPAHFEQLRSLQPDDVAEFEYRMRHKDGSWHWLSSREMVYTQNSDGTVAQIVGAAHDITDRKQAEVALRESEEKYRTLFESIDEGFCIVEVIFDPDEKPIDYRFLTVNPAFEKQTGHKNVIGKTVREIVSFHENEWFERYGKVALTGESIRVEDRSEGFDGWYEVYAFRVGEPELRQVAILFNNITDRKQAEEELRQKNAILNVINESTPTPIFVKDRQGRFIYANPATLEVLGKSLDEVIGSRDGDLYPNPEDAAKVMENDRRIMESGQMEVVEESPDSIRTFLGMKVPYRNEFGEVIGLIGISNDISERVQIERDRERVLQQEQAARQAAEEANRIKDEFLAVLSHELRSPLNPILGWSRLLQNNKLDEARTKQALATIERNAKLQSELIEDLLDVSRILQGKLRLTVSPVNLAATIRAAIETVRLAAEAKSIQIATSLDPVVGLVSGDSTRLQQIVWNLLSNAVKFTAIGGRVEVKLSFVTNHVLFREPPQPMTSDQKHITNYAQITVSDTGKGISPDFLPYVFDYFRQADSATTRKFGGLGLGLAIVRHLVELHGGTIQADSPGEGLGATFTVSLPLMPTQPTVSQSSQSSEQPVHLQGVQVLVVDDDTDTRDFIVFLLEQAQASVIAVASAIEAMAVLSQSQPDILLSDIGMPEMDGYMLLRRIRALPPEQGGEIPAIALTAYAGEIDHQQAMAAGFQRHISKPVEPEMLVGTIARLLHQV